MDCFNRDTGVRGTSEGSVDSVDYDVLLPLFPSALTSAYFLSL